MPQAHAAALGQVAASWSLVEDYCRLIIQLLIDLENEPGHAVTAEMSLIQRMNTISALTHCFRDHDLLSHWEDIRSIADDLRSRRNDVVHAQWQLSGDQNIMIRVKARSQVKVRWEPVPTETLIQLEKEITDLVDDLAWFQFQTAKRGLKKGLAAARTNQPLDRTQSPRALAQDQARAAKKARRQADRDRSRAQPP
jgi:hypothetical protein